MCAERAAVLGFDDRCFVKPTGELAQVHGLEVAQQLLAAVVKAGGSRHVVATAAAALWRLATGKGQTVESGGETTGPAQCFRVHEEALEAARQLAGVEGRLNVTKAKEVLRRCGPAGSRLASRLGKASRVRNTHAHLDVGFATEIGQLKAAQQAKQEAKCWTSFSTKARCTSRSRPFCVTSMRYLIKLSIFSSRSSNSSWVLTNACSMPCSRLWADWRRMPRGRLACIRCLAARGSIAICIEQGCSGPS